MDEGQCPSNGVLDARGVHGARERAKRVERNGFWRERGKGGCEVKGKRVERKRRRKGREWESVES